MTRQEVYPSKYALRFLAWFCPAKLYEGIEGDLLQRFQEDVETAGVKKANWRFLINVMRFFRPSIILRNKFKVQIISFIMLTNYLLIAYRNLVKNKSFSAINIFGLSLGLAACLLIFQFVSYELSFDKFNEKLDRTYRITNDRFQNGKLIQHGTITYPTIGPVMAKDYPEIELQTRLMPAGELNVLIGDKNFRGEDTHFVDERFLSVFTFPLLAGERSTALKEPYTAVLTETTAKKYYGVTDGNYDEVIGKTFLWGLDAQPYTVKGVCADVPENSHIYFDALVSYATLIRPDDHGADDNWTWSDMRHYLVLKPGVDYKQLEAKFPEFSERYFKGDKVTGSIEKFYLQPLKEAHLNSDYEYDIARTASGKAVWAMLIVALFILMIAWINYINLTTSRALDRAKEVGLRKVMGAQKMQLIKQFILESVLVTSMALILAFVVVILVQSQFNTIVSRELSLWKVFAVVDSATIVIFILILVGGAFISGFYPAFVLSSYQPVTVLKGKFQRSSRGNYLRKGLVIFQFAASAALITSTIIVSKQLSFMNDADLGVNITNTVIVRAPELMAWDSTFIDRVESYKHDLTQLNGVISVTTSNRIPGNRLGRSFGIQMADQSSDTRYTLSNLGVDYNYFDTYNIKLIAGRKFLVTDHHADFNQLKSVVINESAVKLLGIANAEEAIGKEILWGGENNSRRWTIIGVVTDYHQESLKNPMEAMIFRPAYSTYSRTSVKIKPEEKERTIASIEATYKKFFDGNSFEYIFLEDSYKSQYNDDNRFGKVISIFTGLAIIVSCLGLIGLSSYTAVQRTKEIGIRKVLGASITSIVSLLSLDFVKLVFIAAILSLPIAYFGMQSWLEAYTYRITPGWTHFALPVGIVLLIAALTISFQILRAARTNSANALKYE